MVDHFDSVMTLFMVTRARMQVVRPSGPLKGDQAHRGLPRS